MHYLKRKKGKVGACAIKLDMAKAYDRVEWEYLRRIMLKLGFNSTFVSLIMRCVTSVSMSIKINGALSGSFRPSKGIWQGDPISPYLFLLCAEGLSCLLKTQGPVYVSRGVHVGVYAPWISHLLFADDCIIFTEASQRGLFVYKKFWMFIVADQVSWSISTNQQCFLAVIAVTT
jgi:hypothetical protein